MSERHLELLLTDIVAAIGRILEYTEGMSMEQFTINEMVVDAVVRNFEIIGEASNRLPEEIKQKYPHIEWKKMRGFRNRIVHAYFDVDVQIVWNIKEQYLFKLKNDIQQIISNP